MADVIAGATGASSSGTAATPGSGTGPTTADEMSSLASDIGSEETDTGDDSEGIDDGDTGDDGIEDVSGVDDGDVDDGTDGAEDLDETDEESEETAATPAVDPAAEVNEDYTVRERNGKKELVFKEGRGQTIYDAYKRSQIAEQVFGEPLSQETAELRQQSYVNEGRMLADFLSGDPKGETAFLENFATIAEQARENGEIGHDPIFNLAERFPDLLEKIHPDAYDVLVQRGARSAIERILIPQARQAAATGNKNLLLSIQHVQKALFGQHTPEAELLKTPEPMDERAKSLEARERKLQDFERNQTERAWKDWHSATEKDVSTAVGGVVTERLKDVAESYKPFPKLFEELTGSLQRELKAKLKADAAWQTVLTNKMRAAKNAVSPEVRDAIRKELADRIKAKAGWILDPQRNPTVKQIMTEAAQRAKAQSDATHARRAQSAQRREPGASGTPTSSGVRTPQTKVWTAEDMRKVARSIK